VQHTSNSRSFEGRQCLWKTSNRSHTATASLATWRPEPSANIAVTTSNLARPGLVASQTFRLLQCELHQYILAKRYWCYWHELNCTKAHLYTIPVLHHSRRRCRREIPDNVLRLTSTLNVTTVLTLDTLQRLMPSVATVVMLWLMVCYMQTILVSKPELLNRFYSVFRPQTLHVHCDSSLITPLVINCTV
jgi:hypothetical protein